MLKTYRIKSAQNILGTFDLIKIISYMIYKCIALFNLLPTSQPHYWLIAADWLEEENKYTEANAFRENLPFLINSKNDRGGCGGSNSSI